MEKMEDNPNRIFDFPKIILGILFLVLLIPLVVGGDLTSKVIEEWTPSDFYYENYDIDVLTGGLLSYNRDGEMQNRISLIVNNSEKDRVITVVVAYPSNREWKGIVGGEKIVEIKSAVLKNDGLVDSQITKTEGEKVLTIDNRLKVNVLEKIGLTYKTYNITLSSTSRDSNDVGDIVDINSATTAIMAYSTTNLGEDDEMYMWVLGSFAGGAGTAGDPWQISNWNQLNETRDDMTKAYILINDIDSSSAGYTTYATGTGWVPMGINVAANRFTGIFDGGNYTIYDLQINNPATADYGLIGDLGAGGIIQNIGFQNISITSTAASTTAGGCGGRISLGGQVHYCWANGTINMDDPLPAGSGGIVGMILVGSLVSNSYANVNVIGGRRTGGGVGYNEGVINNSYSVGNITTATGGGGGDTNGFIGFKNGVVWNSFYDSEVSGYLDTGKGYPNTTAEMMDIDNYDESKWQIADIGAYTDEEWFIDDGNDYPRLGFEAAPGETTPPNITINNPIVSTNFSVGAINFNVTAKDDTQMDSCWVTIDDGVSNLTMINSTAVSDYNVTNATVTNGDYTAKFYCNDSLNNVNNTETRNFSVDGIPPDLVITAPSNGTYTIYFNYPVNYTVWDANGVDSCWWYDVSGAINTSVACGTNITGPWVLGLNTVTVYANDSYGNENHSAIFFYVDNIFPDIEIVFPLNNSIHTDTALHINYTYAETNPDTCWYSNDSYSVNTTIACGTNITTITWASGVHNLTIWINDSAGNMNYSYVNFTMDVEPVIDQGYTDFSGGGGYIKGVNNSYSNDGTVNFTANVSDDFGIDNISVTIINESGDIMNETNVSTGGVLKYIIGIPLSLADGIYNWIVRAYDTVSNFATTTWMTLTVDTVGPEINITYPVNGTIYTMDITTLNYTIDDVNPDGFCWYSFNDGGTNSTSQVAATNWTGLTSGDTNNWTVYCNDSAGNEDSTLVTFFEDTFNVLLLSPADEYTALIYTTNVSCESEMLFGGTRISNVSLWHNQTGTWERNQTLNWTAGTENVSSDLIRYWKFNEVSPATSAIDSMGNDNLELVDNWVPGLIGNSFNFTGVGYYQTGSPWASMNDSDGNITINLWLNKTGAWSVPGVGGSDIISQLGDGNDAGDWELYVDALGQRIVFRTYDGASFSYGPTFNFSALPAAKNVEWMMITIVKNATGVSLYHNATLMDSNFTGNWRMNNLDWELLGGDENMRNGSIDEFGIWSRVLSDVEITQLYNNQLGVDIRFSNFTNFTFGLDAAVLWSCEACDNVGWCDFALENRTILFDLSIPDIVINSPVSQEDIGYYHGNQSLNWTITDVNFDSAWFNYNGTNVSLDGAINETLFLLDGDDRNLTFYVNDTTGNSNSTVVTWNYTIFVYNDSYNVVTYETSSEIFSINATGASVASLVYDGTSYLATSSGNVWSKILDIPLTTTPLNKSFYWNFQSGINTTDYNQSVLEANISICGGDGGNVIFLNFSFIDETAGTVMNASADLADFDYWIGSGAVTKNEIFINTTENLYYNFCGVPNSTFITDLQFKYAGTGYPQRTFAYDDFGLSNTITHQTLYLLSATDGIYSTISVVSSVGGPISGVLIVIEREIGGVWVVVGQGTTGDDGSVTFWVNPNFEHRITATKTGYTTVQVTITPTQALYTITMSSGEGVGGYNSTIDGLRWVTYPGSGTLEPQVNQRFNSTVFSVTDLAELEFCKLDILNATDKSVLTTATSAATNETYCYVDLIYTTLADENLFGRLSVDTADTDGFVIVDSDWKWILLDLNIKSWRTLTSFFEELRDLSEFGEGNEAEFNRMVLFFLVMTLLIGTFMFFSGVELSKPGANMWIIWGIVAVASVGGFLTFDSGSDNITNVIEQFGFFIILTTTLIGFGLNLLRKSMD